MANVSRPMGFRPSRFVDSSAYNGAHQLYIFAAAQANDAYIGDIVQIDSVNRSSGVADVYVPGVPAVKPVVAALTTTSYRGIIAGFIVQPEFSQVATASLGTMYRIASTLRYAMVIDDPYVVFEVEEVGNSYVTALNNAVNKVVDVVYAAGSTSTGIGNTQMDATTVSTSAVKPFRVLRYTQRIDNFNFVAADANSRAKFDLMMNNSDLQQAAATNQGA